MKLLKHIEGANPLGKIIVVGDVHGQYEVLRALLTACEYLEGRDTLLFLGDLIDRGPDSLNCLRYLNKPQVFSCLGNHEFMASSALENGNKYSEAQWLFNGGKWIIGTNLQQKREVISLINQMTYAMSFNWNGLLIGLVHAGFPAQLHWRELSNTAALNEKDLNEFLWSRKRLVADFMPPVPDVDYLLVGHSVVREITWKANVVHIDTGAALFGRAVGKNPKLTAAVFSKKQYFVSIDEEFNIYKDSFGAIR